MTKRFWHILAVILFALNNVSAQDFRREFLEFTANAKASYSSFSDSVNSAFAETLKEEWIQFKAEDAIERSSVPEPTVVPVVSGTETQTNKSIQVSEEKELEPSHWPVSADTTKWQTSATATFGTRYVRFNFFDAEQVVQIPQEYGSFHPAGISETDVSNFWKRISDYDYRYILSECQKLRVAYGYNDWAVLLWVRSLSDAIFKENINSEQTIFSIFILNQLGLMTKIARVDRQLIMLFSSQQTIYSRKFIVVDTYPYYTVEESSPAADVFTYNSVMAVDSRPLDMKFNGVLQLGNRNSYRIYHKESSVLNTSLNLPINTSVTAFYSLYPQLDVNIYATAVPDERFSSVLLDSIKEALNGKTELESINFLLHFCQMQFDYKTDLEQFGYEKPFFLEENFVYNYNDCEDRSILFLYLVSSLIGRPVIFLDYPGHIAAAVKLSDDIKGDYVKLGEDKYYICDPTYIGANVGMTIPQYKNQSVKIWKIY